MINNLLKRSISLTAIFFIMVTAFPCHASSLTILRQLAQQLPGAVIEAPLLVRIEVSGSLQSQGLPVYAHLQGADGKDYLLVIATANQLQTAGISYQIIDDAVAPDSYLLARERRKGSRTLAAQKFTVLHDDGRQIILRNAPSVIEELPGMGFDIRLLPAKPMILQTPSPARAMRLKAATPYISNVAAMIDEVQQNSLVNMTGNLAGVNSVTIGGSPYTITTRHTSSGVPLQKATQYAYEYMDALGLTVSYQDWTQLGYSGRNVIGIRTGKTKPNEIVLITAHLDDMPPGGVAPGADDNASGSAAVLIAAEIMASREFARTVRFVLFTGEEQGLLGSSNYAARAATATENIVAVYNMDMISWDSNVNGPLLRLHTRVSSNPGYSSDLTLANQFVDVVNNYGLSSLLTPVITADGEGASDHGSFWDNGFPAILAIEDDYDDFTPYYHTVNDTLTSINKVYFTNYAKASVGTAAHLAQIIVSGVCGSSNGIITDTPPATGLCSSGTPSSVTGSGPWSWSCGGSNGGTTASCSASPVISLDYTAKPGTTFTVKRIAPDGTATNIYTGTDKTYTDTTAPHSNTIYRYTVSSDTEGATDIITVRTPLYNGWNILGVPWDTSGIAVSTLFTKSVSSAYEWLPTGSTDPDNNGHYTTVTTITPGKGYFVKAGNAYTTLAHTGAANPAAVNVTLKPGWTLISNPYTTNKSSIGTNWQIDAGTLENAINAIKIGGSIYWWNGITYDSWSILSGNPTIEPWKAYWILNMDTVDHILTMQ